MLEIVLLGKQRHHAEIVEVVFQAVVQSQAGVGSKGLRMEELVHDSEWGLHGVLLANRRTDVGFVRRDTGREKTKMQRLQLSTFLEVHGPTIGQGIGGEHVDDLSDVALSTFS